RGIVAPGNSDVPVTSGNPWHGIVGAMTRTTRTGTVLDRTQNITLTQALTMYTTGAAYANLEEDHAGMIAPDTVADFQIYDRDHFALPPEDLIDLSPESVFLAGEDVYERPARALRRPDRTSAHTKGSTMEITLPTDCGNAPR